MRSKNIYILISSLLIFLSYLYLSDDGVRVSFGNKKNIESTVFSGLNNIKNISGDLYISPQFDYDIYGSLINSTDKKLYVYMYTFTYDKIIDLFKMLGDKGVDIKMILENNQYQQFGSSFDKIKKKLEVNSIQIKSDKGMGTNYNHAKTLIMDDKFIIQTANFTYSSFYKNREMYFVSQDKYIKENLEKIFIKDWNGSKILKSDIDDNLLICNIDCRDKIEYFIKLSNKSIYIHTQYLSDKRVIDLLKSKKDLDIKIIVGDNQDERLLNDFNGKYKVIKKFYNHNKSILIDDKYLIMGSMNLSENSLDKNREIGVLLIDISLISQYKKMFENDWND